MPLPLLLWSMTRHSLPGSCSLLKPSVLKEVRPVAVDRSKGTEKKCPRAAEEGSISPRLGFLALLFGGSVQNSEHNIV